MRAARFHDKGDIRVEDIPEPKLSDGKVIVDVEWCGICGSELHEFLLGPLLLPTEPHVLTGESLPLTLGHELCGRVRKPPAGSRFKHGEAVMVDPRILCGSCHSCKAGHSYCCSRLGYVGGSAGGGYGERVAVQEHALHPLGPNIPLEYAAVIEPLAVVHHAVKQAEIKDWNDKTVLVLGGGPIGFALLIDLRAHGATNIIVSEPTKVRREQVSEFAQAVINPIGENVGDRCRDLTGGQGVDVVFDCAGVPAGLESGFDALRSQGLYMNIAVWEKPLTIPCWTFLNKHITLKGVLIFSSEDFEEVMHWMAEGAVELQPVSGDTSIRSGLPIADRRAGKLEGYEKMVTSRIGVEDIVEKGFKELINNKDKHIKILVSSRKPSPVN